MTEQQPNPNLVAFISRHLKTAPRDKTSKVIWPALPTPTEPREWTPEDGKRFLALVDTNMR